jgi:hypothetical protein
MYYYGNPHLDLALRKDQGNPHVDYTNITPALLAGQRLLNAMANKPQTIVHSGEKVLNRFDPNKGSTSPRSWSDRINRMSGKKHLWFDTTGKNINKGPQQTYRIGPRGMGTNTFRGDIYRQGGFAKSLGGYQNKFFGNKFVMTPEEANRLYASSGGKLASPWGQAGRGITRALTGPVGMGGALFLHSTPAGDSRSDFGYADRLIQDRAQKKGLEGRRLYPYKRGSSPVSGRKFRYGEESKRKAPKRESAYQREQRKRKEEEEKKRYEALMGLNRMRIGAISRPSVVPKPVWDSYVGPDGGNFGRYDDIGRFIGLDTDALYESLGIKALMEAKSALTSHPDDELDTIDPGPITEE